MYALSMDGDRKPVELVHKNFSARGGRFSPDGKFLAYSSNESGRFEVWVAPLALPAPISKPVQITKTGGLGGIAWRDDGKELYFMAFPGIGEAAVDITTSPDVQAGTPRMIVRPQGGVSSPGQLSSVASGDGERFVFIPQGGK
jgi:Tol biopolymer transport system component